MTQVDQLYRLQQIDTELRQSRQRLAEVGQALRADEAVQQARQRAQATAAEKATWQKSQRELDLAIRGVAEEAKRTEQRLYSGSVTNPKELTDLQMKVDALGRRRAVLEDELLEAMIKLEEVDAAWSEAAQALAATESEWQQTVALLQEEQASLAQRVAELVAARQERLAMIDQTLMPRYLALQKKHRDGVAVASLKDNRCQGCLVIVSAHKVKLAEEGQLVDCGNCGRILSPS